MVERAKQEILRDVQNGTLPALVQCFNDLHDFADALAYGGADKTAFPKEVQKQLDAWMKTGILGRSVSEPSRAIRARRILEYYKAELGRPWSNKLRDHPRSIARHPALVSPTGSTERLPGPRRNAVRNCAHSDRGVPRRKRCARSNRRDQADAQIQDQKDAALIEAARAVRRSRIGPRSPFLMAEPMDVQESIDDIKRALEHVVSEKELLRTIDESLTTLRGCFPSNKSLFTPERIEFLQKAAEISGHLSSFVEIEEELADVSSLKHYTFLMNQLADMKAALAPFPVCKRVRKEMRELNDKLPAIRERDDAKQQFRIDARLREMEQDPPHCGRKHAMVVREGRYGYFWGCSRYPSCQETAQFTPEQRRRLYA